MKIFRKALAVTAMLPLSVTGMAVAGHMSAAHADVIIGGGSDIVISAAWLICDGGTSGQMSWETPNISGAGLTQAVYADPFFNVWNASTRTWSKIWATRPDGTFMRLQLLGGVQMSSVYYDVKTGGRVTSLSVYAPRRYVGGGYRVFWTDSSGVKRYRDVQDYVPTGMPNAGLTYCYTGG